MMKIFTMRVRKITTPYRLAIVAGAIPVCRTATISSYNKNCNNDPVTAGSFSFIPLHAKKILL